MTAVNIIALGGVREIGKNFYVVEIRGSIFILDTGVKYPESEQLGVDVVIPNLDYLIENKKRVQGIFLTHGHADAIGALPYVLQHIKVPVFGSELTIELAKLFVKNANLFKRFEDYHVVNAETEIEFGDSTVSFFKTTHSIPESLGIVLSTPKGNIVYTGDFKFDQAASPLYQTDFARLAEIGREGVLALLADSANAESKVQIASESEVGAEINRVISNWEGRIIVAAVASNLSRIQQVFDAAASNGRRVVLTGYDVENIIRTGIRLKKLSLADERLIIKVADMANYEDHELIILENGRMGEPINSLSKMAQGRHRYVNIKDGDLVYIVTTPSVAKEAMVARVANLIYKAGGSVKSIAKHMRVSGHANARDLQLLINLLKPTYLFPVQGEYRELSAHADLAMDIGHLPEHIYIMKKGNRMVLGEEGFLHEGSVPSGDVMIDGNAMGDLGSVVLRDRQILSEEGIFIVAMTINKRQKKIISKAKFHTRGFVYVKKNKDILYDSAELVNQTVEAYLSQPDFDWSELKNLVRDKLSKYLYDQTKRRPSILPVIMEVR
ncbi:ribonuclease J [Streptococcus sp. E29BA]|uniref:ribonuclease J n=1 Tax=Streptococcus sp. E29BA TaxID=3278716 RepID=UPI00359EF763